MIHYKNGKIRSKFVLGNQRADMPPLSRAQRENAVGRLQAGQRQIDVARHFHVTQSTISRLLNRLRATGSVADRPRSGRPRATTVAQDRFITLRHLRNRFLCASSTVQVLPGVRRIPDQAVRNRLHTAGLNSRRPVRGPVLTQRHRLARLQWANQHRHWTLQREWRHIWFSDESRFLLQRHDRRRRVYRRVGERYAQNCVDEAPPHGGGGVMVWGAVSVAGRSALVQVQGSLTAQRYIADILRPHALPLLAAPAHVLQQDNARPHTACITQNFLTANNINTLPWPSLSPDLNPIEHIWDELDRRVRAWVNPPANLHQLFQALEQEWNNIPLRVIRRVIGSMPRRCQAVMAARGGHTPY